MKYLVVTITCIKVVINLVKMREVQYRCHKI